MSLIGNIYKRICLISPWVEVSLRKLYWNNVKFLKRFKPYGGGGVENSISKYPINFDDIISYLKDKGVKEGDLLVIHSSYDALAGTGLKPQEIIERLKLLVGDCGTIAMPAIRTFKEEPAPEEWLCGALDGVVCEYNVMRTPLQSGMLPFTLLRMKESVCSHFPLNPLVALGPLAKEMMEHNLDSEKSSAHGKGSCWKFCLDHNAKIIGLGVDLEHHNTMAHVMEEAYDNWRWSDEEWYDNRTFDIIDEQKIKTRVTVRERKPEWGMIRIAELNMVNKLYKEGVIQKKMFGDVPVCFEESQKLMEFLQARNEKGYPYFK